MGRVMRERRLGRRGFLKLSAAVSTPLALDGVIGRFAGDAVGAAVRDEEPATIVGPVGLASPARGIRWSRAGENGRDSGSRSGVSVPSETEASDQFRDQIRAAKMANVDAIVVPIAGTEHLNDAYENLLSSYESVAELESEVFVIHRADDLRRAVQSDRVGLIFQAQGMGMIGTDVPSIRRWSAAGVSIMALTHYWKTPYGYGAFARRDLGLSPRGEQAIHAMEEAGVVLDLSGVGARTAREALKVSTKPVIFSRSNAKSQHDHPLNIDDSLLEACAETDGVVGVSLFPPQISRSDRPSIDAVVNHIDHIANYAGPRHVAIGLDLSDLPRKRFTSDPMPEPPFRYPRSLNGFDGLPALRQRLRSRGYSSDQVTGIFGRNLARVLSEVRVAGFHETSPDMALSGLLKGSDRPAVTR